ncbi:F-box/LRR-repeat protein At4g29420-like [Bidens hawaiensis]|uniref:F-box/LRR-repeat protein At4g29420-like n=1 Tax=Bidens hawaiensis TaxID=980011 RepID=UPI0040497324
MDKLHDSLLLHILSLLDDSADLARCRVASKGFDAVFLGLRSIHLHRRNINSRSRDSNSFKKIFLDLISKLETVESVSIDTRGGDGFIFTDEVFVKAWFPRVSGLLKSLSMSGVSSINLWSEFKSNVLLLISAHCHNLVSLKLGHAHVSTHNLNPMPMLTSLTLGSTYLYDKHLNALNKCFPNLQVLNLVDVKGLRYPKIHHLSLQACHWDAYFCSPLSLTLITPNLITLKLEISVLVEIHVEAPMLSQFHLRLPNLKTLWLDSLHIGSLLSEFPITKIETLTLYSRTNAPRDAPDSKLTIGKVFKVFPNVRSLRMNSGAWLGLEACMNRQGCNIVLDGRKGLKKFCAYLLLVNPTETFLYVACVLGQCVGLLEVSLLIHSDVCVTKSESFKSKCMARWSGLKWRWGIWNEHKEDSWITHGISNKCHKSSRKRSCVKV